MKFYFVMSSRVYDQIIFQMKHLKKYLTDDQTIIKYIGTQNLIPPVSFDILLSLRLH